MGLFHQSTMPTSLQLATFPSFHTLETRVSTNSPTVYVVADDDEGFVKYLADAKTDKVLGVHMIGPVRRPPPFPPAISPASLLLTGVSLRSLPLGGTDGG